MANQVRLSHRSFAHSSAQSYLDRIEPRLKSFFTSGKITLQSMGGFRSVSPKVFVIDRKDRNKAIELRLSTGKDTTRIRVMYHDAIGPDGSVPSAESLAAFFASELDIPLRESIKHVEEIEYTPMQALAIMVLQEFAQNKFSNPEVDKYFAKSKMAVGKTLGLGDNDSVQLGEALVKCEALQISNGQNGSQEKIYVDLTIEPTKIFLTSQMTSSNAINNLIECTFALCKEGKISPYPLSFLSEELACLLSKTSDKVRSAYEPLSAKIDEFIEQFNSLPGLDASETEALEIIEQTTEQPWLLSETVLGGLITSLRQTIPKLLLIPQHEDQIINDLLLLQEQRPFIEQFLASHEVEIKNAVAEHETAIANLEAEKLDLEKRIQHILTLKELEIDQRQAEVSGYRDVITSSAQVSEAYELIDRARKMLS